MIKSIGEESISENRILLIVNSHEEKLYFIKVMKRLHLSLDYADVVEKSRLRIQEYIN